VNAHELFDEGIGLFQTEFTDSRATVCWMNWESGMSRPVGGVGFGGLAGAGVGRDGALVAVIEEMSAVCSAMV